MESDIEFIKKLKKMLKTMTPNEVVASLPDEEKSRISKMITDMELYTLIEKVIGDT